MNLTITPNFTLNKNFSFAQNNTKNNKSVQNSYMNSNLAPLSRDTVSFGSKKIKKGVKVVEEIVEGTINGLRKEKVKDGVTHDFEFTVASALERDAVVPMGYFKDVMNQYFKKMVSEDMNSDKIIHHLGFRIKDEESIFEKMQTLGYKKTQEAIENGQEMFFLRGKEDAQALLGDIIGGRIVLRDDSKKAVKKVLGVLGDMVDDGVFKITKIESYRPVIDSIPDWVLKGYKTDLNMKFDDKQLKAMTKPDFFSYAASEDIATLAGIARKRFSGLDVNFGRDLPNGYQAMHINVELPDGSIAEIQIMGRDVEIFKDLLEDDVYKRRCLKKVKYQPLHERLAPLVDENEKELQAAHVDYTRWVYIGQRLKAPKKYTSKIAEKFLTAPQSILDRGLGYNQITHLGHEAREYEKALKKAKKKRN